MSKRILLHDYGGYAFTYQLAVQLATRGHEVQYIYSDTTQYIKRNSYHSGKNTPNLQVIGIKLSKPFQKYSFFQRRLQEIEHGKAVSSSIQIFHPQVVVSADTPLDAQQQIVRASHDVKASFIFWLQDVIGIATQKVLSKKYSLVGSLIGSYYEMLEKSLVQQSNRVVLISDDFVPLMNTWRVGPEKVKIIPNWSPLNEIVPQPKDNLWARNFGLEDKFCFVYSGILGLKHNPEIFLNLASAFKDCLDSRVVVIAEGPGAEWLKDQKKVRGLDNLVLLNYQPYDLLSSVLGTADVLVAVLGQDAGAYSVPSKVLTYLCTNRPLLLSVPLQNLAARMIEENRAGLVAPAGDNEAFVESAFRLYRDSEMRQEMGGNGIKYARNQFDILKITDRFEQLMESA